MTHSPYIKWALTFFGLPGGSFVCRKAHFLFILAKSLKILFKLVILTINSQPFPVHCPDIVGNYHNFRQVSYCKFTVLKLRFNEVTPATLKGNIVWNTEMTNYWPIIVNSPFWNWDLTKWHLTGGMDLAFEIPRWPIMTGNLWQLAVMVFHAWELTMICVDTEMFDTAQGVLKYQNISERYTTIICIKSTKKKKRKFGNNRSLENCPAILTIPTTTTKMSVA